MQHRTIVRILAVGVGIALTAAVVVAATSAGAPEGASAPRGDQGPTAARSVILVNGDGMGAAQRAAARLHLIGQEGALEMDQLAEGGWLATDPRDPGGAVTDSAAGASAWATGERTFNGAVSVDVDGNPLPVLGQQAKQAGLATGLVTTAQVTDASPAAFFARTPDRDQQDDIARQYLDESEPDVVLGGGRSRWTPEGGDDLVAAAQDDGYTVVGTAEELAAADGPKLLGLFADEEMFEANREGDGDAYDPAVDLATMTRAALDTLGEAEDGFFLLVEEEGIDEFGHDNNGGQMLEAMRQLDAAVAVAREYVAEHPDTLLIVTGDHETGGLAVEDAGVTDDESGSGSTDQESAEDGPFPVAGTELEFVLDWTTREHTGAAVPVTAEGPGAARFTGEHPNTFVHEVITDALGL